jgi:tRNA G18 (ribose-2'-O)-methylase SpoU
VALVGATADPMSRRALRASAGAALRPGLTVRASWDDLPRPLAAAVPRGGRPPSEVSAACIVMGGERHGLSDAAVASCDATVTIPAPGFESLNVAAAAAILIWESLRRS